MNTSTNHSDTPPDTFPDILKRLNHILSVLEHHYQDLERLQKSNFQHFEKFKADTRQAIEETRLHMNLFLGGDLLETPPSYDLPIKNEKLRKTWQVLFRHPEGATAETIAAEMDRHRSTISTYLNMLVAEELADKFRKGHEIFYKAILKTEQEENTR